MDATLLSLILFIAGIPVGYFGRILQEKQAKSLKEMKRKHKKTHMLQSTSIGGIVFILMTLTLIGSVIAEIILPTYKTNPLFYSLLGVIAGLFWKTGK